MCVICVKKKGVRMPTLSEIRSMWERNPDGAGFMYARDGQIHIEKGFMKLDDLIAALNLAGITSRDPLVLHFRIATQGGIRPEMCHPFPVSKDQADLTALKIDAKIGIAHNGIIQRCTFDRSESSDTALFIARYVSEIIRNPSDTTKRALCEAIGALAPMNRFAIMNNKGKISTIGNFEEHKGLMYSNLYHVKNYDWWRK